MKRVLLFLALLSVFAVVRAQVFDFKWNDERCFLGLHIGQAGTGTDYSDLGFGFSMSVYGVYLDFILAPPEYEDDNHVVDELWQDDEAFSINLGYQIPVLPWLRVAPIIGYSQTNYGYTDASTVNIEQEEDGRFSIFHDYVPVKRHHELNYGAALFVQPFRYVEVYFLASRRAIYGGLTLDINWKGW